MGDFVVLNQAIVRRSTLPDSVIVALVFLILSLNVVLGTLGAIAFVALVMLLSVLKRQYLHRVIVDSWYILALPIYCMLSTLWSAYPFDTFYYSTQYFITIYVSILIVYTIKFDIIIRSAFLGLGCYTILSVLFGNIAPVGNDGTIAFIGLADSKNQAGEITLLTFLFAIAAIFSRHGKWTFFAWGCGLIVLIASLYSMIFARAVSAMLFTFVGVVALMLMLVMSKAKAMTRGFTVFFIAFILVLILLTLPFWVNEAISGALALVGKDVTLTGRTVLWDAAGQLISERPIFGGGYAAFWRPENTDAQILWDAMNVKQGSPFNFHNTPLNLLVNLGVVGVLLFFVPVAFCVMKSISNYVDRPNSLVMVGLAIILCTLPRSGLEVVGEAPFNVATLAFFMALAYGPILSARRSPSTQAS